MNIPVIYEDNHILIAEKPVNMPSQEDESGDEDILSLLKKSIKEKYKKPGNVYLGLVHRLDRPAGGLMVFARTSKAASRLSAQMREGDFEKTYMAVISGKLDSASGRLRDYLVKNGKTNIVSVLREPEKNAREAILDYEEIESAEGLSLLKISLLTGRSHQIRVQFANIGHPLWGDQKYGADFTKPGKQLALWSSGIAFNHPVSKERMSFTSEPPAREPWNIFRYFNNR